MGRDEHHARRSTRYYWASGTNPLHWGGALLGWAGTIGLGLVHGAGGPELLAALAAAMGTASLAWSGLWLLVVPSNRRFRRVIDSRLKARYEHDYSYRLAVLRDAIHQDLAGKIEDITRLRDRARSILHEKFGDHDLFAKDNLEKLDTLAISYLQLLVAVSEYDEYLSLVEPRRIEEELKEATEAADTEDSILRETRLRQVELLNNRLDRYAKAQERIKLIQAQCHNVETTMKLLVDQAMTAQDPQRVGKDIDQVLTNIQQSEVLTGELATLDDLEREIDESRLAELE